MKINQKVWYVGSVWGHWVEPGLLLKEEGDTLTIFAGKNLGTMDLPRDLVFVTRQAATRRAIHCLRESAKMLEDRL